MAELLEGRVAVVTGANSGIGRETALGLARLGAEVVVACRSREAGEGVLADIRRERPAAKGAAVALDLGTFASIRRAAAEILDGGRAVHVLVNNAGVAGQRGFTEDGFELQFGVNHVGHHVLTMLLRERLVASAPARVVTVASRAHIRAPGIDFEAVRRPTRSITGWPEYTVSKLANVLFSDELARRLAGTGVTTYSLHPGVIGSSLWRRIPWPFRLLVTAGMTSNAEGARTSIRCASAPELATETGLYYDDDGRPRPPGRRGKDEALRKELWARTVEWTGLGID
jgi:NAD(P)-dependent dehydrogenase (short-subunit alcohol dehydrogenase family)